MKKIASLLHDMRFIDCLLVLFISCLLSSSVMKGKPTQRVTDNKVEALKQQLLTKFGNKAPPAIRNTSESIRRNRDIIRKYKKHMLGKLQVEEHRFPEILNAYKPTESFQVQSYDAIANRLLMYFVIDDKHPEDPQMETIISRAHVKIRKSQSKNLTARITVHYDNEDFNIADNFYVFSNDHSRNEVAYLDITNLLTARIEDPTGRLKISVSFSSNISNIANSLQNDKSTLDFQDYFEPVLEVFSYKRYIIGRAKRQTDYASRRYCVKGDGENRCCRFKTRITFSDIGWDNWIIQPSFYDAYYCDGECPNRFKMANSFAGIKSLLHMKYPSTFKAPCCVPSKLTSLTILYKDETGHYAFMDLTDMIVSDCKCA